MEDPPTCSVCDMVSVSKEGNICSSCKNAGHVLEEEDDPLSSLDEPEAPETPEALEPWME